MSSTRRAPHIAPETAERIRDAAIELFGRDGFDRVRVRDIAARAGVSAGLILHHFGSKAGLRAECDRRVTAQLFAHKGELMGAAAVAEIRRWLDEFDTYQPQLRYIARMLTDGDDELFAVLLTGTRHLVDEQVAAGVMRDIGDRDAVSAYLTIAGLAPLVLGQQLASAMGEAAMSAAMYRRLTLPVTEIYTGGLYTDDTFLTLARQALAVGPASDEGNSSPLPHPDPESKGQPL